MKNMPSGKHDIKVQAFRSTGLPIGSDSITFLYESKIPMLDTPCSNLSATALEWNAVPGASEYRYVIWVGASQSSTYPMEYGKHGTTKSTRVDLAGWIEPDLYYSYELYALSSDGSKYKNSPSGNTGVRIGSAILADPAEPFVSGTITISPSNPKVGDVIRPAFSGVLQQTYNNNAKNILFEWQTKSPDSTTWKDSDVTSFGYRVDPEYVGKQIRFCAKRAGYDGFICSNVVTVEDTTLSGTVTVTPASPKTGDTMTANLYGGLASIPASKIHYKWQVSDEPSSGIFSTISSATGNTLSNYAFVLPGYGFRVRVTADGYEGEIISNVVTVAGGSSYPKGDVDRSGQVGNSDLIMVARHVVHIITLSGEQFTLGDMDNDNVIDNKDIISVARKVVGL
jgi:hypothetical protein